MPQIPDGARNDADQYATALRLEKAKKLLVETNLTLDQISECCGYQNGFYFKPRVQKQLRHDAEDVPA
ncbi:hypothetical protein ACFFNY_04950 [Paenibacillus hodogayensis]|uniref:HTH araC/xylS-type domain-containing protein n=1 Tax=Paenibacillus hodogayensis TaxID=279208 RepID=A0ABV5VRL6_9BACL